MPKKNLIDSRLETINVALIQIKKDIEDECLPCLEHHAGVISSVLVDMQMDLEEKLESSDN